MIWLFVVCCGCYFNGFDIACLSCLMVCLIYDDRFVLLFIGNWLFFDCLNSVFGLGVCLSWFVVELIMIDWGC